MTSATRVIAKQQALHRNTDPRSRRFDFFGREKFMSNSHIAMYCGKGQCMLYLFTPTELAGARR
jgi:hypothetical protein